MEENRYESPEYNLYTILHTKSAVKSVGDGLYGDNQVDIANVHSNVDFASILLIRSCIGVKYVKAIEVLPTELLLEIQHFVEGCSIYIPNKPGLRRYWGETTDSKTIIRNRNFKIIDDRLSGLTVKEIAVKYHLAESTVKKIVYKK